MSRLRWKRQPAETGLRAVVDRVKGSDLHDGATVFARTQNLRGGGWFWYASHQGAIPLKNTANEPCSTEAEAKVKAMAYVKEHLK